MIQQHSFNGWFTLPTQAYSFFNFIVWSSMVSHWCKLRSDKFWKPQLNNKMVHSGDAGILQVARGWQPLSHASCNRYMASAGKVYWNCYADVQGKSSVVGVGLTAGTAGLGLLTVVCFGGLFGRTCSTLSMGISNCMMSNNWPKLTTFLSKMK